MKRLTLFALLLAVPALAQAPAQIQRATLMSAFDLDGEGADVDQVIEAVAIIDDGSVTGTDYTIAAQPDVCRLLDLTIVDTDLSAGTLTVTGTGCLGEAKSCAFAFTAGDDTGVQTLTCTDGEGAYIATVTEVETGTMTGESDETFALGYSTGVGEGWQMWGRKNAADPLGRLSVNPFGHFDERKKISTSGSLSTTVAAVDTDEDPFALVSAGDLLIVQIDGVSYERKVTARASADSITVSDPGLNIPAAGVTFRWKKAYFSSNPDHLLAVPVNGQRTVTFDWSVDANANTGGVVTSFDCTAERLEFPTDRWVEVDTTTVASTSTQANTTESLNLELTLYTYCRFGLEFGTGDDADSADEDINVAVSVMR